MYPEEKLKKYGDYSKWRDNEFKPTKPQPCLHKQCSECHGTGRKKDGTACIHMISCPCPRCTPRC